MAGLGGRVQFRLGVVFGLEQGARLDQMPMEFHSTVGTLQIYLQIAIAGCGKQGSAVVIISDVNPPIQMTPSPYKFISFVAGHTYATK